MALCPAIFDGRILPLYVTDLPQAFAEGGHEVRPFGGGLAAEQSNHRHRWLRAEGQWPRRRAANKRDELASPHVRSQVQETGLYRLIRVTLIEAETASKPLPQCTANVAVGSFASL